jgi:hypothetical protein
MMENGYRNDSDKMGMQTEARTDTQTRNRGTFVFSDRAFRIVALISKAK